MKDNYLALRVLVSTHSRPKAAGAHRTASTGYCRRFNTQPPEGGWQMDYGCGHIILVFQHTAARRRLAFQLLDGLCVCAVSTHSRPKAAGQVVKEHSSIPESFNTQPPEGGWLSGGCYICPLLVSTHSRPKAAGTIIGALYIFVKVSTHSRPKAAGLSRPFMSRQQASFNTQPPEGGWEDERAAKVREWWFQHTAARRRLADFRKRARAYACFNTQPPEGGWDVIPVKVVSVSGFNTQPPEGGWNKFARRQNDRRVSTHSRPKAAGLYLHIAHAVSQVSTHSRPKAAGREKFTVNGRVTAFQHTAARRRLAQCRQSVCAH